jgi:hypothetical protein
MKIVNVLVLYGKIILTIEISPTKGGAMLALLQQLNDNETNNNNFQRYRHMKVNDIHKFGGTIPSAELEWIVNILRRKMDGIVTLDMSLLSQTYCHHSLQDTLSNILPKLQEINLSSTNSKNTVFTKFSKNCRLLGKITWNNINCPYPHIYISGFDLRFSALCAARRMCHQSR